MNRTALQSHIDGLFEAARKKGIQYVHVCWWEDTLQIKPTNHTKINHKIFFRPSRSHLAVGLTSQQWDELTELIFTHIKELESCQKPSEH